MAPPSLTNLTSLQAHLPAELSPSVCPLACRLESWPIYTSSEGWISSLRLAMADGVASSSDGKRLAALRDFATTVMRFPPCWLKHSGSIDLGRPKSHFAFRPEMGTSAMSISSKRHTTRISRKTSMN